MTSPKLLGRRVKSEEAAFMPDVGLFGRDAVSSQRGIYSRSVARHEAELAAYAASAFVRLGIAQALCCSTTVGAGQATRTELHAAIEALHEHQHVVEPGP